MRYERLMIPRSLLRILIQSIALFQISSSSELIIISYPELELDFIEFQTEQDKNEIPDPSSNEVMNDLQQTCQDMQNARTYELLAPDKQERKVIPTDYSQCEDLSATRTLKDVLLKVGDDFEDEIPMYVCYKDRKFGHIYLTLGFGNEFKFVFSQADHQDYPVVYGLVEFTPIVDDSFLSQRHLEKFLVQAHRMYESKPTSDLSLSKLNNNQHYRLCSLIEDARDQHEQQLEEEEDEEDEEEDDDDEGDYEVKKKKKKQKENIERRKRQIPVLEEMFDVTFLELDKLNPVYANLDVVVSTLPCYTNGGELIFLLSEDPLDASAVFVFERNINARSERREISVVQHVSDVAFLRNMDKFYKK